jgi:hypothetical protein
MSKIGSIAFTLAALLGSSSLVQAQNNSGATNNGRTPGELVYRSNTKKMPLISVQGNRFADPNRKLVLFRGVSIGDPDKLQRQGHWNREIFEQVRLYGATLVRIPVHPTAWRALGSREYLALLDQAVEWCTELHLYIDLDWHSIGNLQTELFENPMYKTSKTETFAFWQTAATHFAGNNTVAFFELFNEPTNANGSLGPISWTDWKHTVEQLIGLIRASNQQVVPLVAGFDWAYYLTDIRESPINAKNIGYVTHPYPNKKTQPWQPKWEQDFGFAAVRYPIIATEIGYSDPAEGRKSPYNYADYGPAIVSFLENRGISWVAWAYDPDWEPQLLKSWNFDLTGAGRFFNQAMSAPVPASSIPLQADQ